MEIILKKGLIEKIKPVKILIMDVDGVMTDGSIVYNDEGIEIKSFDVRDGHGIKMLMRAGVEAAIITSRSSKVVSYRAANLGINIVYQGELDKVKAFDEILRVRSLKPGEAAYIGDDIVDLPVLTKAGFSVAVSDAVNEVRERVHYVTSKPGGRGAVREVVEMILKAKGKWEGILNNYLK